MEADPIINPDPTDLSLWQARSYRIRGFRVERASPDIPEGYDVVYGEPCGGPLAYLLLWAGQFRAELRDGNVVYRAQTRGEYRLQTDERAKFITEAMSAIEAHFSAWMSGTYDIDGFRLCGGGAYPEQYDVSAPGEGQVGYMRLRNGHFYAEVGNENIVYEAEPIGEGEFRLDERARYLTEAVQAIAAYLSKAKANSK